MIIAYFLIGLVLVIGGLKLWKKVSAKTYPFVYMAQNDDIGFALLIIVFSALWIIVIPIVLVLMGILTLLEWLDL